MIITNTANKILLLNPPGKEKYFRDYYCAKISKARYYYHPIDFVYLSGILNEIADIHLIDAIAENILPNSCLKKIKEIEPDVIIFLSSGPSFEEDILFAETIQESLPKITLIGSGDIFREYKEELLNRHQCLNAILLDFSTPDIITYLTSGEGQTIPNIIYKLENTIIIGEEYHSNNDFDIPLPKWEIFKLDAYRFPFVKKLPFASILTDFGCPYNCDFCPISTLGYKLRSISSVIAEMHQLKQLGIKELYIRDQTFGVNKNRTTELLESMIKESFSFSWTCLSRTDSLDSETLKQMKHAGCHTIMIGIESANNELLSKHKKNTELENTHNSIREIKKIGIRIGGFFMIGFPGESKKSILATSKLARQLPIDYASFNLVSPRFGTKLRADSIMNEHIKTNSSQIESSNTTPEWQNQEISNIELLKLKKKAVIRFYIRPTYILRRIIKIKTFVEFRTLISEAFSLFAKNR